MVSVATIKIRQVVPVACDSIAELFVHIPYNLVVVVDNTIESTHRLASFFPGYA